MLRTMFFAVAATSVLAVVQFAVAQDLSNRADRKITGEYYRPYSASTYYQGAISHAEALDYYGRNYSYVPDETAKEHAAEIRRNLNAAKKETAKLEQEAKGNKKLQAHLKAIHEHQAKAEAMCDELEKAATEGKAIAACCQDISKEVKAAAAENEKLKETLGVAAPAVKSASRK